MYSLRDYSLYLFLKFHTDRIDLTITRNKSTDMRRGHGGTIVNYLEGVGVEWI